MKALVKSVIIALCGALLSCNAPRKDSAAPPSISGIYPHLAYYNNEGECGTGAVVPWAGSLWVVTYGPHLPFGSSDKLYRISPDFQQIVCSESIGGTPANRMIHRESKQLFIGPYAIDAGGNVRTIPYDIMPGRHTGNARHLYSPAEMIYYGTMEEGFYEVDVKTLTPALLYKDGNNDRRKENDTDSNQATALLDGVHGKGLYSGQGVMVYSNNGESGPDALKHFDIQSGSLSEWDGTSWRTVRRNQFVEVTGPGGIYGNPNPDTDPIWATGWDHKSILLAVREPQTGWAFYRLPKASHSYDGAHGWNTEWPRIRDIGADGQADYLMTMHGMFWRFPAGFGTQHSAGIRPRSAYLKVIGDFSRWNDGLVFGCDDSAQREFLNKRKAKGGIEGPGQSNSNLWFTSLDMPDLLGPNTAEGAVWANERVEAGQYSDPFLFKGWQERCCWIKNLGGRDVAFSFETDMGNNRWTALRTDTVAASASKVIIFNTNDAGEWIRIKPSASTLATVSFGYTQIDRRPVTPAPIFEGLAPASAVNLSGGLLYGLGDNRRALGFLASSVVDGKTVETGYYEMNDRLELHPLSDTATANFIRSRFAIPKQAVEVDKASALIIDDDGRRWRLPVANEALAGLSHSGEVRICREVATERDLFSCCGTFYELPAENADGYAKIRPVASHNFRINDYASYRGMLIMSGISVDGKAGNPHLIVSSDGKAAVWAGVLDDLWKLGKPVGKGGPWNDTRVQAGEKSDPYLFGFYDNKSLTLSHNSAEPVTFALELDPTGNGDWMLYEASTVAPGEKRSLSFPAALQARWIRFAADKATSATALLEYK
ncbi:MAG: hypothetical protein LBD21_00695 [Tannerellaceae bacterium]|jgi:hypothetical protein|nr:hypothetical protein [Tannerellaceae bacterium]